MKDMRIVHGTKDHSHEERLDCLTCLDVEIEYLQALKKAGGKSEFTKDLKPIKCDNCGKEVERWKACSCSEVGNLKDGICPKCERKMAEAINWYICPECWHKIKKLGGNNDKE